MNRRSVFAAAALLAAFAATVPLLSANGGEECLCNSLDPFLEERIDKAVAVLRYAILRYAILHYAVLHNARIEPNCAVGGKRGVADAQWQFSVGEYDVLGRAA